jgi:4'-phosphopantetheinyl transferase
VLARLRQGQCAVLYLVLPPGTQRSVARSAIRLALRQTLALWLDCPADGVALSTKVGAALRIEYPPSTTQVSISHEDGLSLAALHPCSVVGVDVLAIQQAPSAHECLALARDYLGPRITAHMDALPASQQPAAFAQPWTQREAVLKSEGQGLTEWTSAHPHHPQPPPAIQRTLPTGYCGAVAVCASHLGQKA